MSLLSEAFLARELDDRPGCTFEDRTTPWSGVVSESATRAEILGHFLDPSKSPDFAVLVGDPSEYMFWLGAALLSMASLTGLDPTRPALLNSAALQSSFNQFVVSDEAGLQYLDTLGVPAIRKIDLKSGYYLAVFDRVPDSPASIPRRKTDQLLCSMIVGETENESTSLYMTEEDVTREANLVVRSTEMTYHDICYCAVPLSRAKAVLASWAPAVLTGAEIVLDRRFTASRFLSDVHNYNCTYFVFDQSMISDLLALPESDLDRDHRLRLGFGIGSTENQRQDFRARFGCELIEAGFWRQRPPLHG